MIIEPTHTPQLPRNSLPDGTDSARTEHAIWHIPELVREVFLYLDKRDLAPVSRVCAAFHVHANQLLWQTYESADQLRGFTTSSEPWWFPEFIISDVYLNPQTFELGRFTTYAFFVLSAKLDDNLKLLKVIDGYIPTLYLFPRLRSLTLSFQHSTEDPFTTPRLDAVLPPTLEHLELNISGDDVFADMLLSLCATMTSQSQPLKNFSIKAAVRGCNTYGAITQCIRRLPLCKLTLNLVIGSHSTGLDGMLKACSEAEGLVELSIFFPLDDIIPFPPGFNSLKKLLLIGNPTRCLPILSSVQSPSLREFKLIYIPDDDDDEASLAESIAEPLQGINRFKQLTQLHVDNTRHCVLVSWNYIQYLTACSALQIVGLDLIIDHPLTPHQLSILAEAWQHLRSFSFQEWNGNWIESEWQLRLSALECFTKNCPMLSKLRIKFDTSETTIPEPMKYIHYNPMHLDYSLSQVRGNPQHLAKRIAAMWPSLHSLGTTTRRVRHSKWPQVRNALEGILGRKIYAASAFADVPKCCPDL
ncbi:hypothetical protein FRB99_000615 [Tulasnella sp. 403]|nr:hypothetical protein FRB99_000615 [Tulasnella sp. 403]